MRFEIDGIDGRFYGLDDYGRERSAVLNNLGRLDDASVFAESLDSYCVGRSWWTVSTYISKLNPSLSDCIEQCEIEQLPSSTQDWQTFVNNLFALNLTTTKSKAKLSTRVKTWDAIVAPILEHMRLTDAIPVGVKIPRPKKVGELIKKTSYNSNLLNQSEPKLVEPKDYTEISIVNYDLSRSDSEYIDELLFDLERRRNSIYNCLVTYWNDVKKHYEFGQKLIEEITENHKDIINRIDNGDCLDYVIRSGPGKVIPPLRRHIARRDERIGLGIFLYYTSLLGEPRVPSSGTWNRVHSDHEQANGFESILPELSIENKKIISTTDRLSWCMGFLNQRDFSIFCAILTMDNPKFNLSPLVKSVIRDKYNNTTLAVDDLSYTFKVDKKRASSFKTERLNELNSEILDFIINCREPYSHLIPKSLENRTFLQWRDNQYKQVLPSAIGRWLVGDKDLNKKQPKRGLLTQFPSLESVTATGAVSFKKLRSTEGVIEWLKTGSAACVGSKLGNSNKVVITNYIPDDLVALYYTRQVRQFQNLLIIAATAHEDYMIDAVDLNSVSDLNKFVENMIRSHDDSNNPLIKYLKGKFEELSDKVASDVEAFVPVSKATLSCLYLYKASALRSGVEVDKLKQVDIATNIAPLSIISLATHLQVTLPDSNDVSLLDAHEEATSSLHGLVDKTDWSSLFISKGEL